MKPLPLARPHGPRRLLPARIRLSLGAVVGLGLLLPSPLFAAEAARRAFDIPAGDAASTLKHFGAQSSEQLLYSPDDVSGVQTHAVQGEFTPLVALEHMLDRTPLKARQDEKTKAIAITATTPSHASPPPSPAEPPTQPKTSQSKDSSSVKSRNLLILLAGWLVAAPSADAQTAATPPKEEPILLSPFEVNAKQDSGYVGQDTLAGSRLRTDLKDIAAAISPMTAEFLSDIAATNIIDASEYGVGTRVDTDDARAIGPAGDTYNDSTRSIRIRGLPGGSRSMSFFGVSGEVDTYLTERIDVSRGPNSILYGFGSSAGQLNVSTKQASTNKNAYSFSNRIDSWGGQRWTVDANVVPLKNKLGFRAVVLRGREVSWRAAGYNDQDRFFLSGKWQIDRKTTLKAEFEHGSIKSFTPRPFFGVDLKSAWDANGQPIFNNFNSSYTPGGAFTPGAAGTPGTPIRDTGTTNVVGVQERNSGDVRGHPKPAT